MADRRRSRKGVRRGVWRENMWRQRRGNRRKEREIIKESGRAEWRNERGEDR